MFNSQRSIQPGGQRRSIGSSQRAFADMQDPAASRRSIGSKAAVDEVRGTVCNHALFCVVSTSCYSAWRHMSM